MPRRDADHMQVQRERILRATIDCISDMGIERTSIVEIRKRAGLSAGALYTHFTSKDEIVAAALRFGGAEDAGDLPDDWLTLKADLASTQDGDFDFTTLARTQLQVIASSVRPGALHDMLKPILDRSLDTVTRHLAQMERSGQIKLRLSPAQTARAIAALKDGLAWIALSRDRPLAEIEDDLMAALDCLIEPAPKALEDR